MRTLPLVLCVLAVALVVGVPTAATAQDEACEDVLADEANATTGPGGELADAIGDRRSEIGTELNDRWFDARLDNATSETERAEIIADEVARIETRLGTLEQCWAAHASADDTDDAERLDDREVDALHRQVRSLHPRLNETELAAENVSADVRRAHGITDDALAELDGRIEQLREATAGGGDAADARETGPAG